MRGKTGTWKVRRVVRLGLLAGLAAMPLAVVVLWLMFQHKPSWYRPAKLSEADIQEARAEAIELADSVGDQMVQGLAFDVVLLDRRVNEWLTALPESLPVVKHSIPREFSEPAVGFESGYVRIGAHYERDGWRAIVNVALRLGVSGDGKWIELALTDVRGGSLSVPRTIVQGLLDPLLQRASRDATVRERVLDPSQNSRGKTETRPSGSVSHPAPRTDRSADAVESLLAGLGDVDSVDELFRGVTIRNRFVWQNGDRPFRIESIRIDGGALRLRVQPL